jgi:hypothetical protein
MKKLKKFFLIREETLIQKIILLEMSKKDRNHENYDVASASDESDFDSELNRSKKKSIDKIIEVI